MKLITNGIGSNESKMLARTHKVVTKGMTNLVVSQNLCPRSCLTLTKAK